MNGRFDLHIITQPHSEVHCGYFRRLVFGNSLTFSHIPPCFHAKPPDFPRLFEPRGYGHISLRRQKTPGIPGEQLCQRRKRLCIIMLLCAVNYHAMHKHKHTQTFHYFASCRNHWII